MNDKKINEFFQEHGSKDGGNVIYFSCRCISVGISSIIKDLLDNYGIIYFDSSQPSNAMGVLAHSFCLGVSLENLAEWKSLANDLNNAGVEILAYGIEEEQ